MSRRSLAYLAPCVPALHGSGIALRCGLFLDALAEHTDVSLCVVPLVHTGHPSRAEDDAWVRARAKHVTTLAVPSAPAAPPNEIVSHPGDAVMREWDSANDVDLWASHGALLPSVCRSLRPDAPLVVRAWLEARAPSTVLASRLYLAPLLRERTRARWILDLDDHDASMAIQLARLYCEHGDTATATRWLGEAQRFSLLERLCIPRFEQTLVASKDDVEAIAQKPRSGAHAFLANAVAVDDAPRPIAMSQRLLFVGSLGYAPNVHGLCWFVQHVLPLIRAKQPRATLTIVGRSPDASVLRLAEAEEVSVIADPPEVLSAYADARVAICPLFAGTGTRIKILEAFAAGVAVVTTTRGAAGLGLTPQVHALFADAPAAMAEACLTLLSDDERCRRIAAEARALTERFYSKSSIKKQIVKIIDP